MRTYSTSEIAGIMGMHPNTIMLYEKWGYIAPVERKENGYRVYTETHLEQMKLVRMALRSDWINRWRFGRVHYLEKVCKTNLNKLSFIMKELTVPSILK